MNAEHTLVLYVIDEATDEVAAAVREAARLAAQLQLWQGPAPSGFDATPEGSPRTVGIGLRFEQPFPVADRPGVVRVFDLCEAASRELGVCFEVQLDGAPLGLLAPEGLQPWVGVTLRETLGLAASA